MVKSKRKNRLYRCTGGWWHLTSVTRKRPGESLQRG